MITTETIRRDLREIRHYCSRKKVFDEAGERIGNNAVLDTLTKYNAAIRTARFACMRSMRDCILTAVRRNSTRRVSVIHPNTSSRSIQNW